MITACRERRWRQLSLTTADASTLCVRGAELLQHAHDLFYDGSRHPHVFLKVRQLGAVVVVADNVRSLERRQQPDSEVDRTKAGKTRELYRQIARQLLTVLADACSEIHRLPRPKQGTQIAPDDRIPDKLIVLVDTQDGSAEP